MAEATAAGLGAMVGLAGWAGVLVERQVTEGRLAGLAASVAEAEAAAAAGTAVAGSAAAAAVGLVVAG